MVKVGFICEGDSDTYLFLSEKFQTFLKGINIERVNVINAQGCGNLLPRHIETYIERLEKQGSEKIVIITDLDDYPCITARKKMLQARSQDVVVIAVKELEAWFLADSLTMQRLLRLQHFHFDNPEKELEPFHTINNLLIQYTGRGIGKTESSKVLLAKRMLEFDYDIKRGALHPNCPSASYLLSKLIKIGQED